MLTHGMHCHLHTCRRTSQVKPEQFLPCKWPLSQFQNRLPGPLCNALGDGMHVCSHPDGMSQLWLYLHCQVHQHPPLKHTWLQGLCTDAVSYC